MGKFPGDLQPLEKILRGSNRFSDQMAMMRANNCRPLFYSIYLFRAANVSNAIYTVSVFLEYKVSDITLLLFTHL